jgi:hypothetical protein
MRPLLVAALRDLPSELSAILVIEPPPAGNEMAWGSLALVTCHR